MSSIGQGPTVSEELLELDNPTPETEAPVLIRNPDAHPGWPLRKDFGWIYFAEAETTGYVKIGFSCYVPFYRIQTLQSGCPFPIKLLAAIEGKKEWEGRLHAKFAHHRGLGEWFVFSEEIRRYVKFLKSLDRGSR